MSKKHPVIAVTGSSGAGTTTVKRAFEHIFTREGIKAAVIEGDSFHRYDRAEMKVKMAEEGLSHFGPAANLFDKLAEVFKTYGETGAGERRYYLHSEEEAAEHNARLGTDKKPGEFTPWEPIPEGTDLMFYEGLHGLVKTDDVDVSQFVDLGIGVVPVVNLEWIQKIHRDNAERGYSADAIVDTILRRMPDYINYITPQFSRTDINFQRVATVDTSNPFIARDIPTPDESFVIIRFADPKKFDIDFPYLINMIPNSFMSRRNTIVVPGGKMGYAMEIILAPIIDRMMEQAKAD
ncbi:phosphoribulokinase [endosymbiont of unidentified scaly snail isolate Monju]|uniref:phosphoribulokinase n=1 Tax=endosymbiont of unidentified scaly snail isolate Monju TaxID=1248727 RepID=UPI0003892780|nr:phosphoribulokinase [endosymbiont of unidentified scaly snail isolate Monju]BAN68386.1 phosphoribulokinase [endosymbiont of unidentified scaly snail isolate Monju]